MAQPDNSLDPAPISLAWNRPVADNCPFLKLGDQLVVKMVLASPFDAQAWPEARFEVMLGSLIIPLTQEGPAIFGGRYFLNHKGLFIKGDPGEIIIETQGQRKSLGRMSAFYIDTVVPTPGNVNISYVDEKKIQLTWKADGILGNEHFIIQHKTRTGIIEDVVMIKDSNLRRQIIQGSGKEYRISAHDSAGNTGQSDWVRPLKHVGCFPVWLSGNLSKYSLCVLEYPHDAHLRNYQGCSLTDKVRYSENPFQIGLTYNCKRFDMEFQEIWDLKYTGASKGWTGIMTRNFLTTVQAFPSRETYQVRAWWNW